MTPQKLSNNGLKVSGIVAGCMNWGEWGAQLSVNKTAQLIDNCLEIGVTTFDHADIYGHYTTEALFGKAIKNRSSQRTAMQLITKCGIQLVTPNRPAHQLKSYNTSKDHILKSVDRSLTNLQTDYIDLLLLHRPSPLMRPEEIAEAFTALKDSGKVIHFGVSNFTTSQFELLDSYVMLCTNQIEVSPVQLDPFIDGTLDQCMQKGIAPMAYSTLAGGQFFNSKPSERIQRIKKVLNELANTYSLGMDQILLAWILKHPSNIIPVVGSTKMNRIKDTTEVSRTTLTDQDWFKIYEASLGHEVA
ncbi:aldo/keto reductase [Aquimarina brevivitae]|uniref:Putative oxidoreductase n=1 Tax=Aquimarina brevivitae TaxID=323412 RepID=A0A4Q7NU59_9FLAO|nr:aldo/keto reductase [Aquimarina brevivitae]RZS90733.1 putative oxidoreductase [Aquimarina brevivitae]